MSLSIADLKAHANVTGSADDAVLTRLLAATTAHVERQIGYEIDDVAEFPAGTPADLELGVLMLAADWYENREASLVGVTAQPLPFGVADILNEYRNYTFGIADAV